MTEQLISEDQSPPADTSKSKRTGIVIAFAVILALLLLLAAGLKKAQAGPLDRGMAPDITLTGYGQRTVKDVIDLGNDVAVFDTLTLLMIFS